MLAIASLLALTSVVAAQLGPGQVSLGAAGGFTILAKTGISNVPTSSIVGDIGVSPISSTAMTGFSYTPYANQSYSTSAQVDGYLYGSDMGSPTPSYLTAAVSDMQTAFVTAAGLTDPTSTELGAGDISGLTIAPGLYKWSNSVSINTDVTFAGGANDTWVLQIADKLTMASAISVILSGGAQAKNIVWQASGAVVIGTTSTFEGIILAQTSVILRTGAVLNGRILAQSAVTLQGNTVSA